MPDANFPRAQTPASPVAEPSPKWWGSSLTIWGALLTAATTVAPSVLAVLGLDLPPDLVQRLGRDLVAVLQAAGGLAGTLMTIAGRLRAKAPLERRPIALRI